MHGISTKVTAATLTTAVLTILYFVLFDASWGPTWTEFPETVTASIYTLAVFGAGYLVPEGAESGPVDDE